MILSWSPCVSILRFFNTATIRIPINCLRDFKIVKYTIKDDELIISLEEKYYGKVVMPYKLELYSGNRAIVVNKESGHHYSTDPIPIKKAEGQMRLLRAIEHSPDFKRRKK